MNIFSKYKEYILFNFFILFIFSYWLLLVEPAFSELISQGAFIHPIDDLASFPQYELEFSFQPQNDSEELNEQNKENLRFFPIQFREKNTVVSFHCLVQSSQNHELVHLKEEDNDLSHLIQMDNVEFFSHWNTFEKKKYLFQLLDPLKNQPCLNYKLGSFHYEYCHSEHVKQTSLNRLFPFDYSLGTFENFEEESFLNHSVFLDSNMTHFNIFQNSQNEHSLEGGNNLSTLASSLSQESNFKGSFTPLVPPVYMILENGSLCDIKPMKRSVMVEFRCFPGKKSRILLCQEISICSYYLIVETPFLCQYPMNKTAQLSQTQSKPASGKHSQLENLKKISCSITKPSLSSLSSDEVENIKKKLSFIHSSSELLKNQISLSQKILSFSKPLGSEEMNESSSKYMNDNKDAFDSLLDLFGLSKNFKNSLKKKSKLAKKKNNSKQGEESLEPLVHIIYMNDNDQMGAAEIISKVLSAQSENKLTESSKKTSSSAVKGGSGRVGGTIGRKYSKRSSQEKLPSKIVSKDVNDEEHTLPGSEPSKGQTKPLRSSRPDLRTRSKVQRKDAKPGKGKEYSDPVVQSDNTNQEPLENVFSTPMKLFRELLDFMQDDDESGYFYSAEDLDKKNEKKGRKDESL